MDVISVDQMYRIENAGHAMGFQKRFMMENAGAAAVRRLIERVGEVSSKSILVLAGLGNNGGDGLVMARHLAGYGAGVTAVILGGPANIKTDESRTNHQLLAKMPSVSVTATLDASAAVPDIIIDAILGTGIAGEIREPYSSAIGYVNRSGSFVLAVDVPSGLDPDTGQTANICVKADMTVTFHRMKRGIPKRPDLTGTVHAERIGIPPEAEEGILSP